MEVKFPLVERIGTVTGLDLGGSGKFDFSSLAPSAAGKYRNVVAFLLRITSMVDESAAAAALSHQTLYNLVESLSLTMPGGEFCQGAQGRDLINWLVAHGILGGQSMQIMHIAPIPSSEAGVALKQDYILPLAPFLLSRRNFDEEDCLLGACQSDLLKKAGELSFRYRTSLGGNWRLDGGVDKLDAELVAIIAETDEPVLYTPTFFKAETSDEQARTLLSGRNLAVDYLAFFDDAFGALTSATEPRFEVDGEAVHKLGSGDVITEVNSVAGAGTTFTGAMSALMASADPCNVLVNPGVFSNADQFPRGNEFKVSMCREQHASAVRYLVHGYGVISDVHTAEQLKDKAPEEKIAAVVEDVRTRNASRSTTLRSRKGLPALSSVKAQRNMAGRTAIAKV